MMTRKRNDLINSDKKNEYMTHEITKNILLHKIAKVKYLLPIYHFFCIIKTETRLENNMDFLEKMKIKINNQSLLETAFTHSSYSNEHNCENYERLEFLGDAVLELITSEYFYKETSYKEGDMSKIRASFVCEKALATYAKQLDMVKFIKVGHGQSNNINDTIIADVFEAVLGAIYLDQGFEVAKNYVDEIIIPYIKSDTHFLVDYKSILQEMVQTDKKSLEYILTSESGPAHDKKFEVEVRIDGMVYGMGIGKSKKEAEQQAAYDAVKKSARV